MLSFNSNNSRLRRSRIRNSDLLSDSLEHRQELSSALL
jgi:hypothetical protein